MLRRDGKRAAWLASPDSECVIMHLVARVGDQVAARFDLVEGIESVLGASAKADCTFACERYLSRRHAVLRLVEGQLAVACLPDAKNPILFKGTRADRFHMRAGDFFVIGATEFRLEGDTPDPSRGEMHREASPQEQFTLGGDDLRVRGDAGDRLRLLDLMKLPEVLRTRSRREFFIYACGGLRMATGARWVQVLTLDGDEARVLCEDAGLDRDVPRVQSRALVRAAVAERSRPVTYRWREGPVPDLAATAYEGVDWAVCCAMDIPGEAPVSFYLAGSEGVSGELPDLGSGALGLRDIARLVGLVADAVGRAVALQKLEDWQAKLGHFFSGKLVSKILESDDPGQLAPRIRPATVMFFDIRGFSLLTEGNLQRILEYQGELKRAMTAMTQCVFDHDGVVIRYMGDGILACWNVPYDHADHAELACRAALRMVDVLEETSDGWTCGIGLGMGELVAGSLGSDQVYAYDILGPVVNQASRVEGITKAVGVPILVTDDVAGAVSADRILCRRVARFLPVGVETEVDLYTIAATPEDAAARQSIEARHAIHAEGLVAFEAGDWERAFDLLHSIVREDAAARYVYTLALQRKPPRDWHGVVEMTQK